MSWFCCVTLSSSKHWQWIINFLICLLNLQIKPNVWVERILIGVYIHVLSRTTTIRTIRTVLQNDFRFNSTIWILMVAFNIMALITRFLKRLKQRLAMKPMKMLGHFCLMCCLQGTKLSHLHFYNYQKTFSPDKPLKQQMVFLFLK